MFIDEKSQSVIAVEIGKLKLAKSTNQQEKKLLPTFLSSLKHDKAVHLIWRFEARDLEMIKIIVV